MTTAAWEVVAGVIPGEPIPEHTKIFPYQAEDREADIKLAGTITMEPRQSKFRQLHKEANAYAESLIDPRYLNWVQVTWIWF